jgi:hypothetical protein
MPVLTWDAVGQRLYETGTAKGVLFTQKQMEHTMQVLLGMV